MGFRARAVSHAARSSPVKGVKASSFLSSSQKGASKAIWVPSAEREYQLIPWRREERRVSVPFSYFQSW